MPKRGYIFQSGKYYHIYNRGVNQEKIFHTKENYKYCLQLIKNYSNRYRIKIIAYCLMPNHYHFLVKQENDIPVSRFISSLFNAYVQALNKQLNRSGHLFQGRFKHVEVDRHEYLVHLVRYIHLNPVISGIVKNVKDYLFSNYLGWIDLNCNQIIDRDFIRHYFKSGYEYEDFVKNYQKTDQLVEIEKFRLD